jgi:hypothetical protein
MKGFAPFKNFVNFLLDPNLQIPEIIARVVGELE